MASKGFYTGYSEQPTVKIEYWYDRNIKLYTFQYFDSEGNETSPCDYCGKNSLIANKNAIRDETGIMPIKWKE